MGSLWRDGLDAHAVDELPEDASHEVLVVGAGLVGLTVAVRLAQAGRRTVVLDAAAPGALTTGGSTGKVTLLQGTRLSAVRDRSSLDVAAAYLEACRSGAAWLRAQLSEHDEGCEQATAYSFATTSAGAERLEAEHAVARELGLDVRWAAPRESPVAARAAVALDGQFMLDPMVLVRRLVATARAAGVPVVAGCRVVDVRSSDSGHEVETELGELHADVLVLATGTPVVDRGLTFARTSPSRSHVAAFRTGRRLVEGMHLSVDGETRSLRPARRGGQEHLVVAGNDDAVGHARSTAERARELHRWVADRFPSAVLAHQWAAQDYDSLDGAPYAGRLGRDGPWFATGFGKWGLAAGAASGIALAQEIASGRRPDWAARLYDRPGTASDVAAAVARNADAVGHLLGGMARAIGGSQDEPPAEGEGRVGRGVPPVAISTVDGVTRRVSAVCMHLGGILAWNDEECTWDCPLHGSRFAADGRRLEGPARDDLTQEP